MTAVPDIWVRKGERLLILSGSGLRERTFAIALGRNASAHKSVEGDDATPLGQFYVCAKNAKSKYFLSLCISYPNTEDADRGIAAGLISAAEHRLIVEAIRERRMPPQRTRLGGEIYIHGTPSGSRPDALADWTHGCIALKNGAMKEIYETAVIGTPVHIVA